MSHIEFYNKAQNEPVSWALRRFFLSNYNENFQGKTAIDLGCGEGKDTEFLISKGFDVIAIDKSEQVKDFIYKRNLNNEKLKIIIDDFSKIELPKVDLINANFCIHYVKDDFDIFIKKLLKNVINPRGVFIGNFLGKEDELNKIWTTVDKEALLTYFKDFKIFYFSEEKYYKNTAIVKNKFWHVYTVIAQKN